MKPIPNKIDLKELKRLRITGMTQGELAQHFGCTQSAISRALKRIDVNVTHHVALEKAGEIANRHLNVVDQLSRINQKARAILDGADNPDTALKAAAEVRQQLKLQMEILRTLYDVQEAERFQRTVIEAIGTVSPDIRKRIIDELNRRRIVDQSFTVPRISS